MTDPKTSVEAISRQRQRNEICVTLKRSSVIKVGSENMFQRKTKNDNTITPFQQVYVGKNVAEVVVALICLLANIR